MNKMTDIFGNMPKVGDKVAYAEPSTATIAYMKVGTVVEVTNDSIVINREYIGYDAYERESTKVTYKGRDVLKPRKHCKLVILDEISDVTSPDFYDKDDNPRFKFEVGKKYRILVNPLRKRTEIATYVDYDYHISEERKIDLYTFVIDGKSANYRYDSYYGCFRKFD